MLRPLVTIVFLSLISLLCPAQGMLFDTPVVDKPAAAILTVYQRYAGVDAYLFSGKQFPEYNDNIEGHAFFHNDEWTTGDIVFDGVLYRDIDMRYDIVSGNVIVQNPDQPAPIQLSAELVSWFSIFTHSFINLKESIGMQGFPGEGFYDLMINTGTGMLVKRMKHYVEGVDDRELRVFKRFEEKDEIYLYRPGVIYRVRSKRSLIAVLHDRKKEVRRFLNRNSFHFNTQREAATLAAVRYYNGLK